LSIYLGIMRKARAWYEKKEIVERGSGQL
jgi:hypothetical protein